MVVASFLACKDFWRRLDHSFHASNFFFFLKWKLVPTHLFHSVGQDQSTVAQWVFPDELQWAHFLISSHTMPGQHHCQPTRYCLYFSVSLWQSYSDYQARIACCLQRRTRDRKVASSNPGRSGGRNFFSRVNFVCWLLFSVRSTPELPQWHTKDPGQSAKSAGGRLHLNMHTLLTQRTEWADYAAVQALCGNLSGNKLTHNSSGNTVTVVSAHWATVDWKVELVCVS